MSIYHLSPSHQSPERTIGQHESTPINTIGNKVRLAIPKGAPIDSLYHLRKDAYAENLRVLRELEARGGKNDGPDIGFGESVLMELHNTRLDGFLDLAETGHGQEGLSIRHASMEEFDDAVKEVAFLDSIPGRIAKHEKEITEELVPNIGIHTIREIRQALIEELGNPQSQIEILKTAPRDQLDIIIRLIFKYKISGNDLPILNLEFNELITLIGKCVIHGEDWWPRVVEFRKRFGEKKLEK